VASLRETDWLFHRKCYQGSQISDEHRLGLHVLTGIPNVRDATAPCSSRERERMRETAAPLPANG
jgi:hypothetical protein